MRYLPAVFLLVLLSGCQPMESTTSETIAHSDVVQEAKDLVHEKKANSILVKNGKVLFRHRMNSVSYLLGVYGEEREILENATLVDSAVSRATAAVAICGKVAHVYGETMSRSAADFLKAHHVSVSYRKLVSSIPNDDQTGPCPWEQAVEGISDPEEALKVLQFRLRSMTAQRPRPWEQRMNRFREKKVLIVYFSYGGSTYEVARLIQKQIGGDLLEIQPVTAYPKDVKAVTEQAKREVETRFHPDICEIRENIRDYDLIFVGSPCWWYTIAPPVATFLAQQDLSDKLIIPFIVHEGSELGTCEADIQDLCPHAQILKPLPIYRAFIPQSEDFVRRWLRDLKF